MHFCLQIPEVVGLICGYLPSCAIVAREFSDTQRQRKPATLLALARTCKHFYEPAISALWRRLDSFQPFIMCMDRNLYNVIHMGTLTLVRPMYPRDVAILRKYLPRIRHLRVDETELSRSLDGNVYQALSILLCVQPWVPNLKSLELFLAPKRFSSDTHSAVLPFIQFLAHQSLERLQISSALEKEDEEFALTSILSNIYQQHPDLTCIDFSGLDESNPVLSDIIQKYDHLIDVKIPMLSESAMRHLTGLPCLYELAVHRDYQSLAEGSPEETDTNMKDPLLVVCPEFPTFPSLRRLALRYLGPYSHYTRLFSFLNSELNLNELRIWGEKCWEQEHIASIIALIGHCVSAETLTLLHINVDAGYYVDFPPESGIVEPLTKFINLEHLGLNVRERFCIFDQDIADLCPAWPKMTVLHLENRADTARDANRTTTLRGVEIVASVCQRLHSLALNVNARATHLSESPLSTYQPIAGDLRELIVGYSLIEEEDIIPAAKYLYGLFGHRLEIKSYPLWEGDEGHLWAQDGDSTQGGEERIPGWKRVEREMRNLYWRSMWQEPQPEEELSD